MTIASINAISPVLLFFFLFSWIAESSDNAIIDTAVEKNANLCVWIHRLTAKLPRPKLARRIVTFQQKATINAETIAVRLLKVFSMSSLLSALRLSLAACSAYVLTCNTLYYFTRSTLPQGFSCNRKTSTAGPYYWQAFILQLCLFSTLRCHKPLRNQLTFGGVLAPQT